LRRQRQHPARDREGPLLIIADEHVGDVALDMDATFGCGTAMIWIDMAPLRS
jgi:hypothetical protein